MSEAKIITPDERVNHDECMRFEAILREALASGARTLVVDCRGVRYMNSRAVGALLEAYMELSGRDGMIRLVGPDRALRRGFEVVGLLSLLEVCETMEDALR